MKYLPLADYIVKMDMSTSSVQFFAQRFGHQCVINKKNMDTLFGPTTTDLVRVINRLIGNLTLRKKVCETCGFNYVTTSYGFLYERILKMKKDKTLNVMVKLVETITDMPREEFV